MQRVFQNLASQVNTEFRLSKAPTSSTVATTIHDRITSNAHAKSNLLERCRQYGTDDK